MKGFVPTPAALVDLMVDRLFEGRLPAPEHTLLDPGCGDGAFLNGVIRTAHRNRYARFDDLNETLQVLHRAKSETALVATVIVSVAERVLNVPDKVKPLCKKKPGNFESGVLPRLSSGDQTLWEEFDWAISSNRPYDPENTIEKFHELPIQQPG